METSASFESHPMRGRGNAAFFTLLDGYMHGGLRRRAARRGIQVDVRSRPGDAIDLADQSVDAVISSLLLCTVAHPELVVREIRRILRPGGRYAFVEHVAAPGQASSARKPSIFISNRSRGLYSGRVLDLSILDLESIATALADQNNYENERLINSETGEIVFWSADTGIDGQTRVDLDDLDPDLVCIRPLPSWVWYQDMADFADTITDERAGRRLARAIRGKGAFRRFRDELHDEHEDLLPAWYAFRDARAERRAVEWLADNSLVDGDTAARFLAGHPDPDLP